MHHNLVPIPKVKEEGYLEDSGDVLKIITEKKVGLAMTGYGENAFGIKIEKTPIINAGSISWELHRNPFGNSFNLIDIYENTIVAYEIHTIQNSKKLLGKWLR